MAIEQKLAGKLIRPADLNEAQIQILIRPVNFVADNGMTKRGQVDSNLMGAAGERASFDQRE